MTQEIEWHKQAVGGLWEEIGDLQRDFLLAQGLEAHHFLLDIGCGSMRGGRHFVRLLAPGHYIGIDINPDLLEAGRMELSRAGLDDRGARLIQLENFDFPFLGQSFDMALAMSVMTHLHLEEIQLCLIQIDRVLAPGGQFFATFFDNSHGKLYTDPIAHPEAKPLSDGSSLVTYYNRDPFHYTRDVFTWMCSGTGLQPEYLGDWGHPRSQMMMRFTKVPAGGQRRRRWWLLPR